MKRVNRNHNVIRIPGESWESLVRRRSIDHDPNDPDLTEESKMSKLVSIAIVTAMWVVLLVSVLSMTLISIGCAQPDLKQAVADAQAKQTIAQSKTQTKLEVNAITQKAAVNDANAKADPVAHPLASIELFIKQARRPLEIGLGLAFLATLIGVGLSFVTALSWLSKIILPIAASIAVGCLTGLIVLPFFPWVLLALLVAVLGLFAYEWYRYKSASAAVKAVITEIRPAETKIEQRAGTAAAPLVVKPPAPV